MLSTGGRERAEPYDNDGLLTDLSGGLNTTKSPMAVPGGSTPYCLNVLMTDKGTVRTRPGTNTVLDLADLSEGSTIIPFSLKSGKQLVLVKVGSDLHVYDVSVDDIKLSLSLRLISFDDVWAASMVDEPLDWVVTNEPINRVFMVNKNAVPVQLQSIEYTEVKSSAFTTIEIESELFEYATKPYTILFIDGVPVTYDTAVYSGGTLTITLLSQSAPASVNVVFLSWQWLCEGTQLLGRNVYRSAVRFNTNNRVDNNVAIPIELLKNIEPTNGSYPIFMYETSARGDYYSYDAAFTPSSSTEFSFSSAIVYDGTSGEKIIPGISHITFGALDAGGEPTDVHMCRAVVLDFQNNADALEADNIRVYLNGTLATEVNSGNLGSNTTEWGESYTIRGVDVTALDATSVLAASSTDVKHITFDGTVDVGLDPTTVVEIMYVKKSAYIGSGAVSDYRVNPSVGYAVPAYGFQEHCDYVNGSFPNCVTIYQGRLVFSGLRNNPVKVFTSESIGSSITAFDFVNYSILWQDLLPTDPIQISIATTESRGLITALDICAGSLMAFTENKCYRIYGGDSALTPTTVVVSIVSNYGTLNPHSVVGIGNALYFLTNNGVYRLSPSLQVGDFDITVVDKEVNGSVVFSGNSGYVKYDQRNSLLFVGFDDRLLVYNTNKDNWTEFSMYNGYWRCPACEVIPIGDYYCLFAMQTYSGDTTLVSYPYYYSSDMTIEYAINSDDDNASSLPIDISMDFDVVTANSNRRVYKLSSFRTTQFDNNQDVKGFVDGVDLPFGDELFKQLSTQVVVNRVFSTGSEFIFHPSNVFGNLPISFHVNNVRKNYDYVFGVGVVTLSILTEEETITTCYDLYDGDVPLYDGDSPIGFCIDTVVDKTLVLQEGDVLRVGFQIPYLYSTPLFTRTTLHKTKIGKDAYLLLDNSNYQDFYDIEDANDSVGQNIQELLGVWKRPVDIVVRRAESSRDLAVSLVQSQYTNDLRYDLGDYDFDADSKQSSLYTTVATDVAGVGDLLQLYFLSNDCFELVGYQVLAKQAGRNL